MKQVKTCAMGLLVALIMVLATAEDAKAKRYIVKFDDTHAFQSMSSLANGQTFNFNTLNNTPFNFLNDGQSHIESALQNVEMLIINTEDEMAMAMLKLNAGVYVEQEVIFDAPDMKLYSAAPASTTKDLPRNFKKTPWGIERVSAEDAWNASTRGNGVKVLVIDTGIDKAHPAVKDNFLKGKNFMRSAGNLPYDYFDEVGHGTHVAGTVLASGLGDGLNGVAPDAQLLAGRVCGQSGCGSVSIIEAVDWGIAEKVQVMNLSLGGSFPSEAARMAYERAEKAGIVVVAASGNSANRDGDCTTSPRVSYPAGYATTFAVGATDISDKRACFSQFGPQLSIVAPGVDVLSAVPQGTGRELTFHFVNNSGIDKVLDGSAMQGSADLGSIQGLSFEFVGVGKDTDYTSSTDLTGKIALIKRGEISFSDKAQRAADHGAAAVVIYNNKKAEGVLRGTLGTTTLNIPVVGISLDDGEAILSEIQANSSPTADLLLVATDYSHFQGTSMASPHVAGVAALVVAANRNLTPKQVRDILSSTATGLPSSIGPNEFAAGLINAAKAVGDALAQAN